MWFGLVGGPEEGGEVGRILRVHTCPQPEQHLTHLGLVAKHSVHERGPPTVVPVVNAKPSGLHGAKQQTLIPVLVAWHRASVPAGWTHQLPQDRGLDSLHGCHMDLLTADILGHFHIVFSLLSPDCSWLPVIIRGTSPGCCLLPWATFETGLLIAGRVTGLAGGSAKCGGGRV